MLIILSYAISLDDKFYFQLYPSEIDGKSYLFHAYTPSSLFYTINSTDEDECKIIGKEDVEEKVYKNLSSVMIFNQSLLIKTCFGPDKIVEIINKKNETFSFKNNYPPKNLDNVKFCYSTPIDYSTIDSKTKEDYAILTYWVELGNDNKYSHKIVFFYPKDKSFSREMYLSTNEYSISYKIYPQSCTIFNYQNIFCFISSNNLSLLVNYFIIVTKDILKEESSKNVFRFYPDKSIYTDMDSIKPIALDYKIRNGEGDYFNTFLTEFHSKKNNQALLVSSLYNIKNYSAHIMYSESSHIYYGINIENTYIGPNLFNHLVPNNKDLIVIYLLKEENKFYNLIMSRLSLDYGKFLKAQPFNQLSLSNYLSPVKCSQPKYVQSIFINSFIKYDEKDLQFINNNRAKKFYKYQKDIASYISCSNSGRVEYEIKKIRLPQCLNVLDEINEMNNHIIKLKNDGNSITYDINNDPNFLSFRNATIEFINSEYYDTSIKILIYLEGKTNPTALINTKGNQEFGNVTKIEFKRGIYSGKPPIINYRLKYTQVTGSTKSCHLVSDLCSLEFNFEDNCHVPYCILCESGICKICDYPDIIGFKLNEELDKCQCEGEGFNPEPNLEFQECTCKPGYSFYKNLSQCIKDDIVANGPYCIKKYDDISSFPIYDDCPQGCLKCNCSEKSTVCVEEATCGEKKLWFEFKDHKFYSIKINQCVLIYVNETLFIHSNQKECENYHSIAYCLNTTEDEYKLSLQNSTEYKQYDTKISILKKIDNMTFHAMTDQVENNFSEVAINEECENKLRKKYNINSKFLTFKVDIKREDTISTQVVYKFYNPKPSHMDEDLDIDICKNGGDRRNLEGGDSKIVSEGDEVLLSLPVDWSPQQEEYIEELYVNNGIMIFDPNDDFYNDICNKYTTPLHQDIYLQDRKEKYYIDEPLCEENCVIYGYKIDSKKIICKCKLKYDSSDNTSFVPEIKENKFKKNYIFPNLRMLKCTKKVFKNLGTNAGFYISLFVLIIFVGLYLYRKTPFGKKRFDKFFVKLKKNLAQIDEDDDNSIEQNEVQEHRFDNTKQEEEEEEEEEENKKEEEEDESGNNFNESDIQGQGVTYTSNFYSKRNIKNKGDNSIISNETNNKKTFRQSDIKEDKKSNTFSENTGKNLDRSGYTFDEKKKYANLITEESEIINSGNKIPSNPPSRNNTSLNTSNPKSNEQFETNTTSEKISNDYYFQFLNFEDFKKQDKRGCLEIFFSIFKFNDIFIYSFNCDQNDYFSRYSVIILGFNINFFVNFIISFNSSILHLFFRKDKDIKFNSNFFAIFFIIPFIFYIPIYIIKRLVSTKEYIMMKNYEFEKYNSPFDINDEKKKKV